MIWWTKSWNPVIGCTSCSSACDNCYAEALHTQRHKALLAGKDMAPCYSTPFAQIRRFPERLTDPLRWRTPQRIFVGNMGDLFHEGVPFAWLDQIFAVMALCPQHTFMLLTKRPERMAAYLARFSGAEEAKEMLMPLTQLPNRVGRGIGTLGWPLRNVWLGTTIWDQASADRAVPILLSTPAAKRFVSVEPMLGPVDLGQWIGDYDCHACGNRFWAGMDGCISAGWHPREGYTDNGAPGCPYCQHANSGDATIGQVVADDYAERRLDWVICGGETGKQARPMHPDWPRSLRDQCQGAEVPFFFKQWGEFGEREVPGTHTVYCHARRNFIDREPVGHEWNPDGKYMSKCGKGKAGRVLDGRTWEEVPHV